MGLFRVQSEECYCMFSCTLWHFFVVVLVAFHQKNINQSETGTGDKKLSVELYVTGKNQH